MVVFEDGLARKSEYRRFIVRGATQGGASDEPVTVDDTAAMREVLTRRFRRYLEEAEGAGDLDLSTGVVPAGRRHGQPAGGSVGGVDPADDADAGADENRASGPIDPETGRPRRFAYPPSLVVVDGGLPQVNAAQAVLDELGIEEVALVGLAKRLEEVWLPRTDHPVILPRTSEGLYLLQRLRDEAHRFAITFHRQRRSKAMTTSPARRHTRAWGPAARRRCCATSARSNACAAAAPRTSWRCPASGPSLAAAIVTPLG